MKRVSVTSASSTGRNQSFRDNYSGRTMTRNGFVQAIKKGDYSKYHIRIINGIETPVSNPDRSVNNNLG